jgi:PAS domain S-box-containing protein
MDHAVRILVVDDERGIREGCRRILSAEGSIVDVAENGREGLEKLRSHPFDLVLVDLMMPVMGGMEMMEHIRAYDPEIILIVITGFATVESAVDAMKHGAYDYVSKPFTPDQLLAVVNRGLETRRLRLQAKRLTEERDQKLLEVANETSKLHTIVNSLSEGILVFNQEKQLVLWNPAVARMLNFDGLSEAGRDMGEIIHQREILDIIGKAFSPDAARYTVQTEEVELRSPEPRTLMVSLSSVRDESGRELGVVSLLRDITAAKEVDQIKSRFVTMVAHEMRAPLAAIEGYLSAYLSGAAGADPTVNRNMLERAKVRSHSLLDMVGDLLQLVKLESARVVRKKEPLDVTAIIRETVDLLKGQGDEKGLRIRVSLPKSLPLIEADRSEMEHLFTNLVSNAIKYNVKNGRVNVTARASDHSLVIKVADTGIGVDEESLPHLFEEFYRVHNPKTRYTTGTGLGLSIAKKIVESHFGSIEVESEKEKGTTFTVKFPIKVR